MIQKVTPNKKAKNNKSEKKRGPANPEQPLSIEETKGFYDLDTFDEKLAAQQTEEEDEKEVEAEEENDLNAYTEADDKMADIEADAEPLAATKGDEETVEKVKLSAKEKKVQKRKEKLAELKEKRKAAKQEEKEKKAAETAETEEDDIPESKNNRPSVAEVDQGSSMALVENPDAKVD